MSVPQIPVVKPNIKSIAEAAGVSLATVSRVINSTAKVSERKVQSVYRAASMLGYQLPQRDMPGTSFRTQNIALAYTASSKLHVAEWGFIEGMETFCRKRDMRLVLTMLTAEGEVPGLLAEHGCDGVILLADLKSIHNSIVDVLKTLPCVQIVRGSGPQHWWDEVLSDNTSIAQIAIEHLSRCNVRKYGFLNTHPDHESCVERGSYFEFFLKQRGDVAVMLSSDRQTALLRPRHLLAEDLVDRFLALDERPDGLFIPVDFQLPEIYAALRSRGVKPMEDVQIVSCDNCERHLAKATPRPATIDQMMSDVGYQAARQLAWRIQNPTAAPLQVFVKPKLILPPQAQV
jgi:DNA-binding LacI/PurR family transcriptional regulator